MGISSSTIPLGFFLGRSCQEKDVTWEMAHVPAFLQLVIFFRDSAMVNHHFSPPLGGHIEQI